MAQLTGLGIENFRVFKDYTEFDFAPITILTGTNSSGKSSLFKALLLLADNAKRNGLSELDFTGEGHQLGTFETVKTKGSEKEEMTFVLNFSGEKDVLFGLLENGYSLKYTFLKDNLLHFGLFIKLNGKDEYLYQYNDNNTVDSNNQAYTEKNIDLDLFIQAYNERIKLEKPKTKSKDREIDLVKISGVSTEIIQKDLLREKLSSFDKESVEKFIETVHLVIKSYYDSQISNEKTHKALKWFTSNNGGGYNVDKFLSIYPFPTTNNKGETVWEVEEDVIYLDKLFSEEYIKENIDYFTVLDKDFAVSPLIKNEFNNFLKEVFNAEIDSLSKLMKSELLLEYLEAVRANTRRIYAFRSEGTGFNDLLHQFTKFLAEKNNHKYIAFLNTWLAKFQIAEQIKLENIEGAAYKVVLLRKNGQEVNLADLGYGMTQVLPIIIRILLFVSTNYIGFGKVKFTQVNGYATGFENVSEIQHPNGNLFLLEEPETNLHPKLQSLLADFLVDVARKFHITLLVETHSEYLIRKLQYLTAKKEITPADTAIYYFYDPENVPAGKKQVEKINIQEDGRLDKNFGEGFFDEASQLISLLWQTQMQN
jgi:predicted ATPase